MILREKLITIGFMDPLTSLEANQILANAGVTSFSMEKMPRITRAQSMDALSSMATVAGYKAVLLAAQTLPRMFPMFMTAAGTVSPARVFVIGAGVAGLQAIATAKRLGAVVEAYDVRPAVKEQVESMGAIAKNYGIAKDTDEDINAMFKKAVEENDVVIVSGGVSMGDFDLVPGIFRRNNIKLLFEKVAIKPGKPTVFGVSEKVYCLGLPGNPVSTFVLFELLVKPFLYKLMDYNYKPAAVNLSLGESIKRKKTERGRA